MSGNLAGALWMMASMAGFVLNDTLMKSISGDVPLFQSIFLRGMFATVLIAVFAWQQGVLFHRPTQGDRTQVGLRMLGEIGATSLFLTALFNMPLANATAILMVAPLGVTLAASLVLGAEVGWRRYSAILIGFVGVLLVVRPGTDGFNHFSLCALAAVGFIVLRDLATRSMSVSMPSLFITVITSASITAFAGLITLFGTWQAVGPETLLRLAGASVLLLIGYYTGIAAMRVGEIGFVSPFRYTNLLWAMMLGFIVFGDVPSWLTIVGALIIMATGLYTLHRERVTT